MRNPQITLNRDTIRSGRMEAVLDEAARAGLIQRSSRRAREASLKATLAALPTGRDVWVFAYGSLIWNPTFAHAGRVAATLYGFHRRFCFHVSLGRGTPERPGMMLGLVPGGRCAGAVFRVPWRRRKQELALLWKREMGGRAYEARPLPVMTAGGRFPAVAFVTDTGYEHYMGHLGDDAVAQSVAQGEGFLGTSREYLYDTVAHLEGLGLADAYLDRIAARVREMTGE